MSRSPTNTVYPSITVKNRTFRKIRKQDSSECQSTPKQCQQAKKNKTIKIKKITNTTVTKTTNAGKKNTHEQTNRHRKIAKHTQIILDDQNQKQGHKLTQLDKKRSVSQELPKHKKGGKKKERDESKLTQ